MKGRYKDYLCSRAVLYDLFDVPLCGTAVCGPVGRVTFALICGTPCVSNTSIIGSHNMFNIDAWHIKPMENRRKMMRLVTYGLRVHPAYVADPFDLALYGTSIWGPIGRDMFAVICCALSISDTSIMKAA